MYQLPRTNMIYKFEECGSQFIQHFFCYMLGGLKDVDLSKRIDVFDNEISTSYKKESFKILSDVLNIVPKTDDFKLIPHAKPLDGRNNDGRSIFQPGSIEFVRELFNTRVEDNFDTAGFERIYICRNRSHLHESNINDNNAQRRQVLNEGDVVKSLEDIGIRCIFFEDYTVEQKIQIVRNASQIISPQGGGLIFTIWANKNADIVEIYPPNPHQYIDQYLHICRILDIPFRRFCDVEQVNKNEFCFDNMIVDPIKLINFVNNK